MKWAASHTLLGRYVPALVCRTHKKKAVRKMNLAREAPGRIPAELGGVSVPGGRVRIKCSMWEAVL